MTRLGLFHVHGQFKKCGLKNRWYQWKPPKLTTAQIQKRVKIAKTLNFRTPYALYLKRIITGDEKWMSYDNTARQIHWAEPGAIQILAKPPLHQPKILLCLFLNFQGPVNFESLKNENTVNGDFNWSHLRRLMSKFKETWPKLMKNKDTLLLHDNAKPRTDKKSISVVKSLGFELLPQPYIPLTLLQLIIMLRDLYNIFLLTNFLI